MSLISGIIFLVTFSTTLFYAIFRIFLSSLSLRLLVCQKQTFCPPTIITFKEFTPLGKTVKTVFNYDQLRTNA